MGHVSRARDFVADAERTTWHDAALWFVRAKRDAAVDLVPDWERLRDAAAAIKREALARLPELWLEFESKATRAGAVVHWARDAAEANAVVTRLLRERGITRVVKSKSMLTEECGLNPWLARHGIEVVDTDLGERIVQLRDEPPSHIVMPAIHLRRSEVGETFTRTLGAPEGLSDPDALAALARRDLRARFLAAQAGITGANFAVAETGSLVVVSNEGNVDLGTALPPLHIACVGLEKIVPAKRDLPVFLRLLARSATGQAITAYTSHFGGPLRTAAAEGAGAKTQRQLHVVIVDNGRSRLLGQPAFREALACIRCGACLNTCPVYRRSGGHSYASVIPGPIGSVLEPARDARAHAELPHACTLCGSCSEICPVQIPLDRQLLAWRGVLASSGLHPRRRRLALGFAAALLARPRLAALAGGLGRRLARVLPPAVVARLARPWTRERALPPLPAASFRTLYRARRSTARPAPATSARGEAAPR
ncbi:MAG: lactate utilization protein B [Myxococcota bacterium]